MTPPLDSTAAAAPPPRERSPFLLALAVIAVLIAVGAASLRSWRDLAEQRAHEADLAASIAKTETKVRQLEERNRRLEKDAVTLERLARQELGLVKPDDLVVVFPATTGAVTAPRAPTVSPPEHAAH
ncbi:MAG TPA: septum formation initiator family protein [Thermoanaerobaculia bacterium]|nr:septum formation initiator family protein [Thermoanaerobaculia bacterium]